MSNFNFYNIDSFFIAIQKRNRSELRNLLGAASAEINSKFGSMTSSEKLINGRKIISVINNILDSLDNEQDTEKDYLYSLYDLLSSLVPVPKKRGYLYREVFVNERAYDFYIQTLEYLGVLSELGEPRRGFQARADAIFKSENFKTNVFRQKLMLKDYIAFLNKCFDAQIKSNNKLSDGKGYKWTVNNYFKENFKLD